MTVWKLRIGADTDVGRHRQRNEDSFCVLLPGATGEDLPPEIAAVVAVADGMGGHDAGDVASAFVVDAIRSAFSSGELHTSDADLAGQLAAMLRRTNVGLHTAAMEQGAARGMGSTVTLAAVRGDTLVVAHVGDSRLYRLRSGRFEQITEDHSWTAEQRRRGLISHEEEAHHPRRNLLTDCIGVDREITVFTATLDLREGDRFLLCSDGLHGPVSDDEIASILATPDPEAAASLLVERANEAGGPDNITAVVLDVRSDASSFAGSESEAAREDAPSGTPGSGADRLADVPSSGPHRATAAPTSRGDHSSSAPTSSGDHSKSRARPRGDRADRALGMAGAVLANALPAEGERTEIAQSTDRAGPGRSLESGAQVARARRLAGRWALASATLVSALVLVWGLNRPSLDRNEIREPVQIREPAERSTARTADAARKSDLSRDAIQGARESGTSPDSADSIPQSLKPPADH